MFDIARAVFVARSRCGFTQVQLAEKIGTAQTGISRLENAAHFPSFSFLKRIADELDQRIIFEFKPKDLDDIRFVAPKFMAALHSSSQGKNSHTSYSDVSISKFRDNPILKSPSSNSRYDYSVALS